MDQPRKRVLIIDDDEMVLSTISDLVAFLGYEVKTASEALDAVDLLQQETFDLVIVDMIMPQVGGLALSKVIRQERPRLPIVAISGYYEKIAGTAQRPEFNAVLPKPLTLETLKTTLKDVFSERGN